MAWKNVATNNTTDIKKHLNKQFVGTYIGSQRITNKIGEQNLYEFEGDDGVKYHVYGFTNLDRCMESVATGEMVRLTYLGTKNVLTKFGLRDVHQVCVEVQDDEVQEKV